MLAWLSRDERTSCCCWSCNIFETGFILRPLFQGLGLVSEPTLFFLRLVSVCDRENWRCYVKTVTAGDNDNEEAVCNVSRPKFGCVLLGRACFLKSLTGRLNKRSRGEVVKKKVATDTEADEGLRVG